MTVLLYLVGQSVGPIGATIFIQMYQTTINGIVGSFPASQSYNLIILDALGILRTSIWTYFDD